MKFTSDKITFTEAMKSFVKDTFEKKLNKLVPHSEHSEVKLTKLNNDNLKIDLTVDKFRVQATNNDFYAAYVEAVSKIKKAVIRFNKKEVDSRKRKKQISIFDLGIEDTGMFPAITKEKIFDLKPISLEEAVDELELTDYSFYVFKNINDDNNISVIYKRHVDEYGLIKCR